MPMKVKSPNLSLTFKVGQVWQMDETTCHIREVGKTLVHYKMFKVTQLGRAASMANKDELAQFLRTRKAVLSGAKAGKIDRTT